MASQNISWLLELSLNVSPLKFTCFATGNIWPNKLDREVQVYVYTEKKQHFFQSAFNIPCRGHTTYIAFHFQETFCFFLHFFLLFFFASCIISRRCIYTDIMQLKNCVLVVWKIKIKIAHFFFYLVKSAHFSLPELFIFSQPTKNGKKVLHYEIPKVFFYFCTAAVVS